MSGPDTDEFHAVVTEQIEQNRQSIDRLSEENRLLRDAIGRLLGKPPSPRDDPDDELAAARRRKRERGAHRHAGFIALPITLGGLLTRAVMHARTAAPLARIAWAAAAAVTAGAIVGGTAYVVTHAPEHHIRRDSSVTSPPPSRHAPRRALRSPIPRGRGLGKGAAARSSTRRAATPPAATPRSRAAAPSVSPVTVRDVTRPPATTLPTVLPSTVPPLPTPTVTIPTPLPSVTKAIGHLVCHLNLLGIRVCVHT